MLTKLKNTIIRKALRQVLDGDKGSTALGAVLTVVLASNVNFVLALEGLHFKNAAGEWELAKLALIAANGALLYLIGKYPKVAAWLKIADDAVEAAEKIGTACDLPILPGGGK